jgi:hypothetical protein
MAHKSLPEQDEDQGTTKPEGPIDGPVTYHLEPPADTGAPPLREPLTPTKPNVA